MSRTSSASINPSTPAPPNRVLIAEDEHLVATSMAKHVAALGMSVVGPAANGQQAVELAQSDGADLALVDIRMPVMDGLTLSRKLFWDLGIPVVILSAFSEPDYLRAGVEIGVFGYILKPVSLDDLRVGIAVAWGNFHKQAAQDKTIKELQSRLEERKLVERAKGILMQRRGLTEDIAMKTLQKFARDHRRRMPEVANMVIEKGDLPTG